MGLPISRLGLVHARIPLAGLPRSESGGLPGCRSPLAPDPSGRTENRRTLRPVFSELNSLVSVMIAFGSEYLSSTNATPSTELGSSGTGGVFAMCT